MEYNFSVSGLSDLAPVARKIIELTDNNPIVCFYGEMGAGKTTLISEICRQFGVSDSVTSPTFAIVNEYLTGSRKTIYHFDFYRLKSVGEAFDMGAEEYFDSGNICFIEWPENVSAILPEHYVRVEICLHDTIREFRIIG